MLWVILTGDMDMEKCYTVVLRGNNTPICDCQSHNCLINKFSKVD
jgi:uncharacterized membrane protein